MSRVLPLNSTLKKNLNTKMMFQSMEMDLGLGSLPDLLFAEELSDVQEQLQAPEAEQQPLKTEREGLFDDLEAFNNGWKEDFELEEPPPAVVKEERKKKSVARQTSISNILEQAVTACDIKPFMTIDEDGLDDVFLNQLSPAQSEEEGDNTANLIEEMEEFLIQHEFTKDKVIKDEVDQIASTKLSERESKQAEEILDALMSGNISLENMDTGGLNDSGYLSSGDISGIGNISNISEIVTEDGQKIVIVIASDTLNGGHPVVKKPVPIAPAVASPVASSPYQPMEEEQDTSSDPEWSPDSPVVSRPKKAAAKNTTKATKAGKVGKRGQPGKRGPYKRSMYNIKDKKERKKLQNVEAARRYRDKKKAEADSIGDEGADLEQKNKELKSTLSEMENEVKTLKKLMAELGLIK